MDTKAWTEIQSLERELLAEFIRICRKHGLKYFMSEGSMLGAIRHQGMIPWDDDIDVAMFREDYERFLAIAPAELEPAMEVQTYRNSPSYIECMAKLVNRRRFVKSFAKKEPFVTNVWIDIFVIDGLPGNRWLRSAHKMRLLGTKMLLMWSNINHYAIPRQRSRLEQFLILVPKWFHMDGWLNTKKWLGRLDRCMASVPVRPDGDVVTFLSEYRFRTVTPYATYGAGRSCAFDGMTVVIPERVDVWLTQVYGDYMSPPPEKDRGKHHLELLDDTDIGL